MSAAEQFTVCAPVRTSRNVLVMLFGLCVVAMVAVWLPPMLPPTIPRAHVPMWWAIVASSGGLAVLLIVRPTTRRVLTLGLGWQLVVLTLLQAFLIGDLIAMFGTFLAVPALAMLAGRLRPKPRKALVAAHAVAAACWIGIAVAFVAMSVVAMSANDIDVSRVVYELMALFDITLLPWANFATFLTGIALSLTTKWGLIKYYWVAAKLTIAAGILIMAFGFLHDSLESAATQAEHLAAAGGSAAQITNASDVVLWGFGCAALSLIGALLLSLYKPGGRIRAAHEIPGGQRRHSHSTNMSTN